jgi:hypothetical protein
MGTNAAGGTPLGFQLQIVGGGLGNDLLDHFSVHIG